MPARARPVWGGKIGTFGAEIYANADDDAGVTDKIIILQLLVRELGFLGK
jgi:hypothetical protein